MTEAWRTDLACVRTIMAVALDNGQALGGEAAIAIWQSLQPFIGHIVREELSKAKK